MTEEKQEFIHETKEREPTPEKSEISIMDILQMELRRHMEVALEYKKKIQEAKTQYKKSYYNKKLKKNNTEALKVLTAIERVKRAPKPTPPVSDEKSKTDE